MVLQEKNYKNDQIVYCFDPSIQFSGGQGQGATFVKSKSVHRKSIWQLATPKAECQTLSCQHQRQKRYQAQTVCCHPQSQNIETKHIITDPTDDKIKTKAKTIIANPSAKTYTEQI